MTINNDGTSKDTNDYLELIKIIKRLDPLIDKKFIDILWKVHKKKIKS